MEPTHPTYERSQFPYDTSRPPYESTQKAGGLYLPYVGLPPIPPPPPLRKRQRGWMIAAIVFIIIMIGATAVTAYLIGKGQVGSPQRLPASTSLVADNTPTQPATQASTAAQAMPTPTLDVAQALQSGDFSLYIRAFAQAMANKDYSDIQKATDTLNFQEIPLDADGIGTWNDIYSELTTSNLSFVVQYPPITAEQEGYTKCGYGAHGMGGLVKINAADVRYVVGTAIEPTAGANSAQTAPNGTVFIFELPVGPTGTSWLWRGVTFNNQLACV